jgi:myo-inositol catabolism protein IolC
MYEIRSKEKMATKKNKINKTHWSTSKEMDYGELHMVLTEKI